MSRQRTPVLDGGKRRTSDKRFRSLRDATLLAVSSYAQYLVPLATLPLMARTLGAHGFGYAAIATATYFFASVVVDFGLSLPLAARLVAQVDDGKVLRARYRTFRLVIFGTVVAAAAGVYLVDAPYGVKIACLGGVAGGAYALSDVWILVAHRQFGRVVVAEWSGRILYLGALVTGLLSVPSPACVPVALALGAAATTVVSCVIARPSDGGRKAAGDALDIKEMLSLGVPAAASRILVTAYGQGASVLYAMALAPGSLGLYAASDRVVRAAQGLANPVSLAVFPGLSAQRDEVRSLAATAKRYTLWSLLVSLVASIALAALATPVTALLYGHDFSGTADVIRIQAFLLPFAVGATMVVTNFFNVIGDTRTVFLTTAVGLGMTVATLAAAHRTGSLSVMAGGSVVAEASAFFFAWSQVERAAHRRSRRPADAGHLSQSADYS